MIELLVVFRDQREGQHAEPCRISIVLGSARCAEFWTSILKLKVTAFPLEAQLHNNLRKFGADSFVRSLGWFGLPYNGIYNLEHSRLYIPIWYDY